MEEMKEMKAQSASNGSIQPNLGAKPKVPVFTQPPMRVNLPPGPPIATPIAPRPSAPTHAQILMKKPEGPQNQRSETTQNHKENMLKLQKTKTKFINRLDERRQAFK